MSARAVHISSSSLEVLFEGTLLKAPPLNRRGRKKWHERYFVLRANRTLECHKSKKAAESQKSPRRRVDLRECINLEIGLEYKSLQHIMSLGTFKRTFFYAAPSDALMLQWAHVLEKAKNAKDGESIEVLDIGLRRTKDNITVQNVKPPSANHSFTIGSPKKYGATKSAMTLSNFTNGSTETMDLRMIDSSRESGSTTTSDYSLSPQRVTDNERDIIHTEYKRISSSHSSTSSSISSPNHTLPNHTASKVSHMNHSQSHATLSQTHMTQPDVPIMIPNKVPPPTGMLVQAARDENGFFVNLKNQGKKKDISSKDSTTEDKPIKERRKKAKEHSLIRAHITKKHNKNKDKNDLQQNSNSQNEVSAAQGAAIFHSNMKQSFRYRKIVLHPEKPLFENISDSDDENSYDSPMSAVPGPHEDSSSRNKHLMHSNLTTIPDELVISEQDLIQPAHNFNGGGVFSPSTEVQRRLNFAYPAVNTTQASSLSRSPGNSYKKVSIAGPRYSYTSSSGKAPLASGKIPLAYRRSNSQSALYSNNKPSPVGDPLPVTSLSQEDNILVLPPPLFSEEALMSPTVENFDLPARPPSDGFLYSSQSSLDDILVAPPEMFNSSEMVSKGSMKTKRKLSRTTKIYNTDDLNTENTDSHEDITSKTLSAGMESGDSLIPKQPHSNSCAPDDVPDRDSTESSDTGYTSSTSPGYQEANAASSTKEYKLTFEEVASTDSSGGSTPKPQKNGMEHFLKSSTNSLSSMSSDNISRFYIPLVFHSTKNKDFNTSYYDPNQFSIQVCLVENSDDLIKDLVALKSLESFSLMECDEIHGEENVAAAQVDDFTVQTSLEDLEFGFSVMKSKQKDLFMRKVRQFTFEIKNLFGTSKPFSCDVEIRHADQLTVLPIEVR